MEDPVLDFFPVNANPEHFTQNKNLTNQKLHNLHFRLNLQEQMFVLPEIWLLNCRFASGYISTSCAVDLYERVQARKREQVLYQEY